MASIRKKTLSDGSAAYLVRFRASDGSERSKQFRRRRDAEAYAHSIEVDRFQGTAVDPRRGRTKIEAWFDRWWPTVTDLRPSTRLRDEQYFRSHVVPVFGATPLARLDRTDLRPRNRVPTRPGAHIACDHPVQIGVDQDGVERSG